MKNLTNTFLALAIVLLVVLLVRVEKAIDLSTEAVYNAGLAHTAAAGAEVYAQNANDAAREAAGNAAACL